MRSILESEAAKRNPAAVESFETAVANARAAIDTPAYEPALAKAVKAYEWLLVVDALATCQRVERELAVRL